MTGEQHKLKKLELQTNFGGPWRLGATSTISSWGGTRSNCIGVLDKKESFDVDVLGASNEPRLCRKHLWKVLYKVSSKQNDRWATQALPTEPLVLDIIQKWKKLYYR
jgi:hypothetical protein